MDSLTQAALGAVLGGAIAGKALGRTALLGGAVLGTVPDLDVVIDYGTAIADFTQHRGFSHSLFILIPFGIVLALILHRWQPELSLRRWLIFTLAILITHPLLDVLTTYGTQLFWPFGPPLGTATIFIIDPLYTLPLLFALVWSLVRPAATKIQGAALLLSTCYLGWALAAQQLIDSRAEAELARQGLQDAPRMVQPMPFNTLLWRVTVMADEERLEMVAGVFEAQQPLTIERFPHNRALLEEMAALPEGQRLIWFTSGFLDVYIRDNRLMATDIRLGVPGAHPFTFAVAERGSDQTWLPAASTLEPRPTLRGDALSALWARLSGDAQVLCLATLEALPAGETCS